MALQLLKLLAFSMGGAVIVTALLIWIGAPLAALTRRIVYPNRKAEPLQNELPHCATP
jgi:hypothetical protein